MATNTYEAIATQTLSSDTATITFSSIPATYTDLVLVATIKNNSGGSRAIQVLLNNDTGTNYSTTDIQGTGTSAASTRSTGTAYLDASVTCPGTEFATLIMNFQNYANTTTFKSILNRNGAAGTNVRAVVSLWRSTTAINSIKFQLGGADLYSTGSTFSLYGIKAEPVVVAKATGGTIVSSVDGYTYHAFTSSGTFTPTVSLTSEMLIIAGGGGGGSTYGQAAGGGAGGLVYLSAQSMTAIAYAVTVGGGGATLATFNGPNGSNGSNSLVAGFTTAVGGGGGASYRNNGDGGQTGSVGGSGGGGGANSSGSPAGGTGGAGTAGQGNAGGNGFGTATWGGGGGGGAGGVGNNAIGGASYLGGNGGVGLSTYSTWGATTGTGQNISGTYWFAGGGGGSDGGSAGSGNGAANTGGGGNGQNNGYSGVVIIRYLSA